MTTEGAVALIMFVCALVFFGLARWIKLSENNGGETAKLFFGIAFILTAASVAMLIVGPPTVA